MSVIAQLRTTGLSLAYLLVLAACVTNPPPDPGPPAEPNDELTERSLTPKTGWWWLAEVTSDQMEDKIDEGFRLIDVEIVDGSAPTFTAAFVSNIGVHEKDWWWDFGLTASQVDDMIDQHDARIIDLETYVVDGTQLFAVVMVANTGDDQLDWWWYFNVDSEFLDKVIEEHDRRIVDFELYQLDGEWYFSAVLISNIGAGKKDWRWYYGVSYDFINEQLADSDLRLVDFDLIGADSYAAVLEDSPDTGWWWWLDGSMATINQLTYEEGARIIDIEQREGPSGDTRFTALLLENGGPTGIPVSGTDNPELDPLVQAAMDFMRYRCVGAAILGVSYRGQVVGTWGLGRMHGRAANDWDEECGDDMTVPLADPVQSDTPMRIGSISKTITAAMVRWAIKTVAMQELGITMTDTQVENLLLFDPGSYPPLIPGTDITYPAPLIPRTLYNLFAGNTPYPVQVSDSGDDDSQTVCANLQGFADTQWQDVTLGHVLGHRTGLRRSAPNYSSVVVPSLPVLRDLTSMGDFAAQEQQLRTEYGNAAIDQARAELGLATTGEGFFIPAPTLVEILQVLAGRCLRFELEQRVYSNTGHAFSALILQQLMQSGRYSAEIGRPSTHGGSALDIFFRSELGVATTGNSGAFLSLPGPNLEGFADREPTKRHWNGTSYYADVWDEKRPHCVMTSPTTCSFGNWLSASPGMTNWAWQVQRVAMGHDISGVSPGTGSLAVEVEPILRFLADYWVNGDGNNDFLNPQIGEERNGDWTQYVWHNGALDGTFAWALQVGGPSKPASRDLPPIDEHGRITDDFGNLVPVSLMLPDGLDIFVAINQNQIDRKCELAEGYTCDSAYNRLPSFLYHGASQVNWSLFLPIIDNDTP